MPKYYLRTGDVRLVQEAPSHNHALTKLLEKKLNPDNDQVVSETKAIERFYSTFGGRIIISQTGFSRVDKSYNSDEMFKFWLDSFRRLNRLAP